MNESTTTTEHPLTEAEVARIWDENRSGPTVSWAGLPRSTKNGVLAVVRAVYELAAERTHADDGWEPLGDGKLRAGDEVRCVNYGVTRFGVVASLDADGDPWTDEGWCLGILASGTWSVRRAPVTRHRLPTERPAHLADVTSRGGDTCAYMALNRWGDWVGVNEDGGGCVWVPRYITACTLDGTRLVRDGRFEDGAPRFREETGE